MSFNPGGMFAGERRQAAREECVVCSVKGSPGASQTEVVVVVSTKDERRGGAIEGKEYKAWRLRCTSARSSTGAHTHVIGKHDGMMECRFEAAVTDGLRRSERACGTERLRELEGRSERTVVHGSRSIDRLLWRGTSSSSVLVKRVACSYGTTAESLLTLHRMLDWQTFP